MQRIGGRKRRMVRLIWIAVGVLVLVSGIAAMTHLDIERYRSDSDRIERLASAELPLPAAAAAHIDWPQWRGPNRDGVSLETGLLTEWPAGGPAILWKRPIERGFSSFAIAAGRLITMDQEEVGDQKQQFECVVCLDVRTGNELWRFRYPNRFDERFGPGPRSTPAIDGDRVYTVGPTGIMHCLHVATGAKIWRRDLLDEFHGQPMQYGVSFSPLIEGGLVYVAPGGPNGNSIAALNKLTGELAWKSLDDPASYSSPIATDAAGVRQVLFLTNTELVSVAPETGRIYWRYPWKADGGFNIATPIAFGHYVFVASGYGKGCALLEVTTGADGTPRVGRVYEHNRLRPYFASPVRLGDHIFGFDQMDLVCMNVRTGVVAWREKTIREFRKGSLLALDGCLIVLGENGTLTTVEATPSGYREKSTCRISEIRCWAPPAVADGRLFVRDDAQITCFDLRKNQKLLNHEQHE